MKHEGSHSLIMAAAQPRLFPKFRECGFHFPKFIGFIGKKLSEQNLLASFALESWFAINLLKPILFLEKQSL